MKNRLYCLTITAKWKGEEKFIVFCSFKKEREKNKWRRRFRTLLYLLNQKWNLRPYAINAEVTEFQRNGSFAIKNCDVVIDEIENWVMETALA